MCVKGGKGGQAARRSSSACQVGNSMAVRCTLWWLAAGWLQAPGYLLQLLFVQHSLEPQGSNKPTLQSSVAPGVPVPEVGPAPLLRVRLGLEVGSAGQGEMWQSLASASSAFPCQPGSSWGRQGVRTT